MNDNLFTVLIVMNMLSLFTTGATASVLLWHIIQHMRGKTK